MSFVVVSAELSLYRISEQTLFTQPLNHSVIQSFNHSITQSLNHSVIHSLWHITPALSEIREEILPRAGKDEVYVRALYSLVSSGTESLVSYGGVPESLFGEMAVPYMGGSLALPVKYGYSLVGEVITETSPLFGKRVHLLHPHQDMVCVKETDLFVLPEGVPSQRATLASNLETALNAVWDSGVSLGDRVLVTGFGLIGSLVARLLSQIPAVSLSVCEIDPRRMKSAGEMGFHTFSPQELEGGYDLAFHCSAHPAGLQTCLDTVGFEGKVIELSWYGEKVVPLNLGGSFHSQRKQLISSQVSHLPEDRRGRWDYRRRKETVFSLLANPVFDQHLGQTAPFAQSPEIFQGLRNKDPQPLCWILAYEGMKE